MKKVLYIVLVLIVAGGAIGYYMWNKPHETALNVETAFQMNASDLYAAFESDSASANTKYLGKMIEISGEVTSTEKMENGTNVVYLKAPSEMGVVSCQMMKEETTTPTASEKVTIKGHCNGFEGDLLPELEFKDCIIIKK
ncbi:MAG: hypothetical protein JNM00_03015 [Flavobacteriales bacterium]|nr:hypothetical protein [Flavobacteriales bacterium]